jgi:hypothetical protein
MYNKCRSYEQTGVLRIQTRINMRIESGNKSDEIDGINNKPDFLPFKHAFYLSRYV